jgi:hypothetical protein
MSRLGQKDCNYEWEVFFLEGGRGKNTSDEERVPGRDELRPL